MTLWKFRDHVKWAWDPILAANNTLDSPTRTDETTVGGGGVEWGAWFELKDSGEKFTTPALAFLVDLFLHSFCTPAPHTKERERATAFKVRDAAWKPIRNHYRVTFFYFCDNSWFPTMTLTIEFKFPIPSTIEFARRTVGSCSRYINQPQGRHDAFVEVWTAPSNIGEGKEEAGWREKQLFSPFLRKWRWSFRRLVLLKTNSPVTCT
jgi:hypothetical protein